MRCTSCTPSPAPPNGGYLPKPVDPLQRVDEGIFDRGNLFLIQSTHHQLPRHQAASPHSLRFMMYTTPSTPFERTAKSIQSGSTAMTDDAHSDVVRNMEKNWFNPKSHTCNKRHEERYNPCACLCSA
jgi:hypothetical protein